MTNPTDPTRYPPPDPERLERALAAMRARRAHVRRVRTVGVSSALVVVVAIVAVALSTNGGHRLRVAGPTSTTSTSTSTSAPAITTATTTPATPTTTTVVTRETQQLVYRPYTEAGVIDPSLRITESVTGTCVAGENSGYRCFAASPASAVYDPCFLLPRSIGKTLVCPSNPATPDVVEFTATSPPPGPLSSPTRPWAFQLSDGWVCTFVSAAWGGLGPYDCQRNDPSAVPADCREPTVSQPMWSAECQNEKSDASPFAARQVNKVWF